MIDENGMELSLVREIVSRSASAYMITDNTKGSGVAGAAYAAPGKLWGPLECPQWWLEHALLFPLIDSEWNGWVVSSCHT